MRAPRGDTPICQLNNPLAFHCGFPSFLGNIITSGNALHLSHLADKSPAVVCNLQEEKCATLSHTWERKIMCSLFVYSGKNAAAPKSFQPASAMHALRSHFVTITGSGARPPDRHLKWRMKISTPCCCPLRPCGPSNVKMIHGTGWNTNRCISGPKKLASQFRSYCLPIKPPSTPKDLCLFRQKNPGPSLTLPARSSQNVVLAWGG